MALTARSGGMVSGKPDLRGCIFRIAGDWEMLTKTKVTALANQKGGVGKTTTAINLSACLAARKLKTLLIDLDPQCNTTSGLGIEQTEGVSVYGPLIGEGSLSDMIRQTEVKHLDLIPSEVDLAGAEIEVARSDRYLHRLADAMKPLVEQDRYDHIILDCPPSLGILTMNALAASKGVIIPTQCEYYALEGLAVICRLVDQIRSGGANASLEITGILMTMYDGRTNLCSEVVKEVREHFAGKVFNTVIPRNVRLGEAPSFGKPAVIYDGASSGAKAYKAFADEFIKHFQPPKPKPDPVPAQPAGGATTPEPQPPSPPTHPDQVPESVPNPVQEPENR